MKERLTREETGRVVDKYLATLSVKERRAAEQYACQMLEEPDAPFADLVFAYMPDSEEEALELAGRFTRLGALLSSTLSREGAAFD